MSPTTVALAMLIIIIACILINKIPMNFIMFLVPLACLLILDKNHNIFEASKVILTQINMVMSGAGYMLMFGIIYFSMLTETGLFEIIINKMISMLGERMNMVVIMIMTTVISCVAYLTANMSTTYLIVFPVMISLYKKYNIDRNVAFIVCQTAVSAMCWLPWGIGIVNSAMMAGVSPEELSVASIPWGLCFIPAIILQWAYFAFTHKRKNGTLGLPATAVEVEASAAKKKEGEDLSRPQFFWINLIIFAAAVAALAYFKIPSYLVFIVAAILTAMINYPKDFGKIWNKSGTTFFNVLIMLLGICFYLAAFNAKFVDGVLTAVVPQNVQTTSMVTSLAGAMTGVFPEYLLKYMFLIFLILVVPIIHFIPYQVYNTMYPLFISVGATFGMTSMAIIAPFVCNLGLATSVTPMNSATYVGCTLCEIEVDHFCNWGGVIMFFTNLVVIACAILTGVMVL